MKKHYLLLLLLLFSSPFLSAQITEAFDNEIHNATTFSEGGITFNITSQKSYFRVQGNFPNTGWNGTANDNKYLDNSYYTSSSQGVEFTVSAANGAAITLKSMWIYVSTSGLNLSPIGTLTITGKRGGETVFTVSRSNPFNPSAAVNNGFTYFDLATLGGQDNSNAVIDQYVIATDMGIGYLSIDAVRYQCAPVAITNTTQTNVSCYGGSNGTAGVTIAPSGTLSYNWEPGSPTGDGTANVTGLTAGTWTCTVTNACGSTNTATFTITGPSAALDATAAQTNVNCFGNASGGLVVTPSGGTAPYTYAWSTGETTASIFNKAAGNYSITITDSKGCTKTKAYTITQPAVALGSSGTATNAACYGTSTGSASVTPVGGTSPYSILWSTGQTASSISNLTAGNYSVTVTDANSCTHVREFIINQPSAPLTAATDQTPVLCYGSSTGSAGVTPSGGTAPYSYLWSNGATTQSISGLLAGSYSATITDASGCTFAANFTLSQPDALSATATSTAVLCYGDSNGSAGVSVSGGNAPYTYLWSSGETTAAISNYAAGDYSVTITDANGCTLLKSITIAQPSAPLTATTAQTGVSCYALATGSADVTAEGGTPPYTYAWSSGSTAGTAANLSAGDYTVAVTDANGCMVTKNITITQPAQALSATTSQTDVVCSGDATASATVSPSGGTAPYNYVWSSGEDTATVNGMAAGLYSVTVVDANNCTLTKEITINGSSAPLSVSTSNTRPLCYGEANGTAVATAAGGTAPYSYSWSTGAQTASINNLTAGQYTVTVTDSNQCTDTETFMLYQPGLLEINTVYIGNNICYGGTTASINVYSMNGGTYPFTYAWSTGATGPLLSNLVAGTYSIVVTDANGCTTGDSFIITEPPTPVTATFTQTDISCNGESNGSVTITPSGGIPPYDYQIFPSGAYGNNFNINGLSAGDYSVVVRDAYNCSTTLNVTITQPDAPLEATTTHTDVICWGMGSQGSATVFPTGGTPPYTYLWSSNGGNEATATNLGSITYTVTVTDANNCSIEKTVQIENVYECGSVATTWNGTAWSNGAPVCEAYAVIIEGDYTSAVNGSILACSLTVNSGDVVISANDVLNVNNAVSVLGGTLTFESDAQLFQYSTSQNTGEITYKRDSNPLYNLDYTIWSSPVSGSQSLKDFSPQTLDNRFYVYNTALNAYSNYQSASGIFGGTPDAEVFVPGKGYLIRMPDGISGDDPTIFTGNFYGTPHNGDISIPLNTGGNRYNAVGNPYPSTLRLYTFLMDNEANLDNGTVYFWRKRNGTSDTTYTTVSLAGVVDGCGDCPGEGGGEGSEGGEGNNAYTFSIKPGQGFFVKAAADATMLYYNNYMRWTNNSSPFYRTADTTPAVPHSKYWLNITNAANDFSQAAVAYMEGTTLNLDYGYDGRLLNDGAVALYTTAQDTKLSIQARGSFAIADEVPLSFRTTVAGMYTISLHNFTGLFDEGQDIYLTDLTEGITHNLKNSSYSFSSETGTFDRFKIVYQTGSALGLGQPAFTIENVIAYKDGPAIVVRTAYTTIKGIAVYDIRGRLLYEDDAVNAVQTTISGLAAQEQMLILQVTTTDGYKATKKIIF